MTPEYVAPATLQEASALGRQPGAVFMAGGTDVISAHADGRRRVERVVVLRALPELRERRWEGQPPLAEVGDPEGGAGSGAGGVLHLGAGITHDQVANDAELRRVFPALSEACRKVGGWSTRVAGTLGGNVCTAAPSADSAGPLLVYGAQVVLADGEARRTVPLRDFFLGVGRTVLTPGEILVAFRLPHPGLHGAAFVKFGRREAMEIALVSATAMVRLNDEGRFTEARLALGTAAPSPVLVDGFDDMTRGRAMDEQLLDDITELLAGQCRPRAGSFRCEPGYRQRMLRVAASRALAQACGRATRKVEA